MYRVRQDMTLIAAGIATFEYALYWLTSHSFMEQPHHYVTALVLVGWLASLPFVACYRYSRTAT